MRGRPPRATRGRSRRAAAGGFLRAVSVVACLGAALSACSARLGRSTTPLNLPDIGIRLDRDVHLPERRPYATVPLVVLIDDGPPVNPDTHRRFSGRTSSLVDAIVDRGYAVWRPLRRAWPEGRLVIHSPDRLSSLVQLGLQSMRGIPELDSVGAILVGIGTGGVVSAVVTQRRPDLVRGLALVNAPGRSIDQIIASETWRDSVAARRLRGIFDGFWQGAYADSEIVLSSTAATWRAWLDVTDELPEKVGALRKPTFVLQGTADRMIPLLDIERYRREIARRPESAAESAVGVTHDLKDAIPDPLQDPESLSPRLRDPLVNWLQRTFPSRPAAQPSRR